MTHLKLDGCKVAVLAAEGFEQSELFGTKLALVENGATADVISTKNGEIRGIENGVRGDICPVDAEIYGTSADTYDALLIPGGEESVKHLRADEHVRSFVEGFVASGKPIAAICHGTLLLLDANGVKGRKITSENSLQGEFVYAGANWASDEVVTDQGLVTSRDSSDLSLFNRKMIEEFAEGKHPRRVRDSLSA